MQIRCLCSVPDYYAAWLIVLKIAENGQPKGPYTRGKAKHSQSICKREKTLEISKELSRDHITIK